MRRSYDAANKNISYEILESSKKAPSFGFEEDAQVYPLPELAPFALGDHLNVLAAAPDSVKLAGLVEAKLGNLENQAVFEASGAAFGPLGKYLQPGPGYKSDYQKIALTQVQPIYDEKVAVKQFINRLAGENNAHLGLVSFSERASGPVNYKDSFSSSSAFGYPHVELNASTDNKQLVMDTIDPAILFLGTNTSAGIEGGVKMLDGPQHRKSVPKTIILLTDGLPTTGSPKAAATLAGKSGIRIMAVGFFHTPEASRSGPSTLKTIVSACGNGSKMYIAPDLPALQEVLKKIGNGDVALANSD